MQDPLIQQPVGTRDLQVLRQFVVPQKASPSDEETAKDAETRAFAVAMAKIGWETKAEGITVLHVAPLVTLCPPLSSLTTPSLAGMPLLESISC